MTKRRRWSKFSIRFGLISISVIAILLALHSHFQTTGKRRHLAVLTLSELGVAFPTGDTVRYEEFTFTGTSGSGLGPSGPATSVHLVMPKVVHVKPSALFRLGRRILGSEIFNDYGALLVYKPVSKDSEEFLQRIADLPNVDSIHYYQNTIEDSLLNQIKLKHPQISLTPLGAEAPKDTNGNPSLVQL